MLRGDIVKQLWGQEEGSKVLVSWDPKTMAVAMEPGGWEEDR